MMGGIGEDDGRVLARIWEGLARMMGGYWRGSGRVLARIWEGLGRMMGGYWRGSGRVLARIWEGLGRMMGGYWRGSGRDVGGSWEGIARVIRGSLEGFSVTNNKKSVVSDIFFTSNYCIYQIFFVPLQRISKTIIVMKDKTFSSYQGYGHRVQLIRRADIARSWSILDNRRVISSVSNETLAKDIFLNHVAGIVRQLSINFQ